MSNLKPNLINITPLNIVAVSGGLNTLSKTESLVQSILDELAQAIPISVHFIKLNEIGPLLGGAIYRNQLPAIVQADLDAIESADVLVVGTPVYRASFTGLFKHFFDFVEQTALVDVPVFLSASGGSERHALVLEHQLRPLFSFFEAQTLPIGVYATDKDFSPAYTITSPQLQERIQLAVERALPILQRVQEVKATAIQNTKPSGYAVIVSQKPVNNHQSVA